MSQNQYLQDADAMMAGIFADAGIADSATYTAPGGGSPVPCTVLIDRDVQQYGDDDMPVAAPLTMITLYLAEVATPEHGGIVTVGAEAFELDTETRRDESRCIWAVTNG